ncbi:serine/threonine protein phosphatase [Bacteriophage T5-like cott162]|uniref:Phosphatase n=12 Tax=Markadamsvirinae TaxID=2732013 RepID=A0A7G8ANX3_9CAUD|nr:NinI-like serine-threonine phosphatase [Escherichia phage saus132]YP_009816692.1 NinI-like serine-threonine phosphatase [Salmonella phage Seafire]YP_009851944.1 NinI-like serine-threonine phosphatase [Salmonella phage 2-3]YP_009858856.1 NinI-like serine-threonine phosphatase [Salmonella phage oselot]ASU02393.1 serine/threonine protein phosphatase [Bacteriophage T5-like chee130_1]ASU02699.1 serine/threonine protein phosphatase [Bacteriophage T5-like poul149]ASU02854.1 serine/threonine prote
MKKEFNLHEMLVVPDDVNLFFVGDIHGCNDMLEDALKLAGYKEKRDYVVCVGDLIDRGPQNLQVLAKFLYNPRFRSVRGNHDQFMIAGDYANWMYNGGMWAMNDLDTDTIKGIAEDMAAKMPVFMTVLHRGKKYGVVHGGIPFQYKDAGFDVHTPNWDDIIDHIAASENDPNDHPSYYIEPYLWDRDVIQEIGFHLSKQGAEHPYFQRYTGFKDELTVEVPEVESVDFVFHGHTGVPYPILYKNRVYLDTGGVFNGQLTVAQVNDEAGKIMTFTTDKNDSCGEQRIL